MTRTPAPGRRAGSKAPRVIPVLPIALGALALVIAIGIAIAVGGDDSSTDAPEPSFGRVIVDGTPLPTFDASTTDPAVGATAPRLEGMAPDGTSTTVGGGGQPTIVVFLAHWCPHCQAELPRLVELQKDGTFDGLRTVAVLTGTNPDAPNFPPAAWLEREGWTGDVMLDDKNYTAADAYGLAGYPFLVALDSDGKVVERTSGELSKADIQEMVASATGESP